MQHAITEKKISFTKGQSVSNFNYIYFCPQCGAELYGMFEYTGSDWGDSGKVAREAYKRDVLQPQFCPICFARLSQEKGWFLPDTDQSLYALTMSKDCSYEENRLERYGVSFEVMKNGHLWPNYELKKRQAKFDLLRPLHDNIDMDSAKKIAEEYAERFDVSVSEVKPVSTADISSDAEKLKNYIWTIVRLENNIYSITRRLEELHFQKIRADRAAIYSEKMQQVTIEKERTAAKKKQESFYASRRKELDNFQRDYYSKLNYLREVERRSFTRFATPPIPPQKPVLEDPKWYNKKRVCAENEEKTAMYEAKVKLYNEELERCQALQKQYDLEGIIEKNNAIKKAHEEAEAAKKSYDTVKSTMDEAREKEEAAIEEAYRKAMEAPVGMTPAMVAKELVYKEVSQAETLLKKLYETRNELYAYNIIFGKYRDVVALSSFYEYLMTGRCEALAGGNGAYNLYESEIRSNTVIAQLEKIVNSLDDIKRNQYMMYTELKSINSALGSLNDTTCRALDSIRGIEMATYKNTETLERIEKTSDVIAYNTAVNAYYSKVNAELTDALGYMVALS